MMQLRCTLSTACAPSCVVFGVLRGLLKPSRGLAGCFTSTAVSSAPDAQQMCLCVTAIVSTVDTTMPGGEQTAEQKYRHGG